jgi:hypothetical protein
MSSSSSEPTLLSTAQKFNLFLTRDNTIVLSDKQNFYDILYWLRQLIGLIIGICFGAANIQGFQAFLAYILISSAIIYIYYSKYQYHIDEEELGRFELLSSGFMPGAALFLLAWIIFYSQQFNINGKPFNFRY